MADILKFRGKQPPQAAITESSQQVFIAGAVYAIRRSVDRGHVWTEIIDASGRRISVMPESVSADVLEYVVIAYRTGHVRGLIDARQRI